jgi:hypothetical protein
MHNNGPTNLTLGYRESMNGLVLRAMDSVTKAGGRAGIPYWALGSGCAPGAQGWLLLWLVELSLAIAPLLPQVNTLSIALLVAEGCCMCALAIAYMWLLLQRVASQRYSLFAVFLVIPSAFLRALAAKKVMVRRPAH